MPFQHSNSFSPLPTQWPFSGRWQGCQIADVPLRLRRNTVQWLWDRPYLEKRYGPYRCSILASLGMDGLAMDQREGIL